ncbi:MAG: CAP domain-containing protein [Spirochaetales bacterium]|nr:CAP domain-containing protein [Spirochaetales bacterium]MCF7938414.1 CAP domain-containing protein [Spirochaetales bacterium]
MKCSRFVLTVLLLIAASVSLQAQERDKAGSIIYRINIMRRQAELSPLVPDTMLEKTAQAYAVESASWKRLSHTDLQGNHAVDRLREMGGTSVLVGEVLGASKADLPERSIPDAWAESSTHQEVILDPRWTHVGCGIAEKGETFYAVVLFTRKAATELTAYLDDTGLVVSGHLFRNRTPVLFDPVDRITPDFTDRDKGRFVFLLPGEREKLIRFGYEKQDGNVVITDFLQMNESHYYCPPHRKRPELDAAEQRAMPRPAE